MHLADHLDRVGKSWDGRGDEPDGDRATEPLAQPTGGLEALPHRAGIVRAGSGEDDRVLVVEADGEQAPREHRDDAIVGAELIGEPGAAGEVIEPEREPGANVEAGGEHERHDDRVGLRGGSQRGGDVSVRCVDEADRDVELRSLGRDAVDEPDHGFAVLRRWGAVGDGDESKGVCAGDIRRQPGTARPDHLPHRALRRNPVAPPISTLCTACFADGTRVFPGREEWLTPRRDRCADRAARAVASQPSSSSGRTRRVRSTCCSCRHAAIAPWLPRAARAARRGRATRRASCSSGTRAARPRAISSTRLSGLPTTPGHEAAGRLDHGHDGDLAAVEHVVAEADRAARACARRSGRRRAGRCPRSGRTRTRGAPRRRARARSPG